LYWKASNKPIKNSNIQRLVEYEAKQAPLREKHRKEPEKLFFPVFALIQPNPKKHPTNRSSSEPKEQPRLPPSSEKNKKKIEKKGTVDLGGSVTGNTKGMI
jgi:hypothetical protein